MEREPQALNAGRFQMTSSPTSCLKCGHHFAPGAPEPSWCPGCGKLCSAYDVPDEPPDPDEIPETPQEQRRLRIWFCVLFFAGPLGAVLAFLFSKSTTTLLPGLSPPVALGGMEPLLALVAGAAGAGLCLAKMWYPRRPLFAQLVFGLAMGVALMFGYLGLAAVVSAIIYIIANKL